ncbi:MAG: hypothetical protein ABL956_06940 [Hyphomonadaceae bacterium]
MSFQIAGVMAMLVSSCATEASCTPRIGKPRFAARPVRTRPLVLIESHVLFAAQPCRPVGDLHHRGEGNALFSQLARRPRRLDALLAVDDIPVRRLAAKLIFLDDEIRGLVPGPPDGRPMLLQRRT